MDDIIRFIEDNYDIKIAHYQKKYLELLLLNQNQSKIYYITYPPSAGRLEAIKTLYIIAKCMLNRK